MKKDVVLTEWKIACLSLMDLNKSDLKPK